jgi:hypothetical protein
MNDLARRLVDAGPRYPFPPTPDVAGAVLGRLPARRRSLRRPLAVVVAAIGIALAALFGFSDAARSAILDLLDAVPGVRIERVEELPPSTLLTPFDLGRPLPLEQARQRAGFTVRLPSGLGQPDGVYFDRDPAGGAVVTVRYGNKLVLTEWRAAAVLFYKRLGRRVRVEQANVEGALAVWIEGGDHAVYYFGVDAAEHSHHGRLAGNVLIWQVGEIGYRLEADVSRTRAIELAESLRP